METFSTFRYSGGDFSLTMTTRIRGPPGFFSAARSSAFENVASRWIAASPPASTDSSAEN